jgi:ABC-type Fe3+/spermidine/putrescine transport system ATPase subunit
MRFFGNKDKKDNDDVYASPRTNYVEEFGSDNSFWDDLREGKDENPQREEEPIPPNAIQPNMAVVNTECDYNMNQNGELEKDCTKHIIARDMYVDESAVNIVESQSNENKGE